MVTSTTRVPDRATQAGSELVAADLLYSPRTLTAHIELTSRCTLRCVYCPVSQPGYAGRDLPLSSLPELIRGLRERRTRTIFINGLGETTMIPGWVDIARHLLDEGFRLRIISNLARMLEEDEICTLVRFDELRVSCDTIDPELFRRLRRSASLATVFGNQERIQTLARRLGRREPKIVWSSVVCDRTVFGLPGLVRAGIKRGVAQFTFCNLVKCADLPGALTVAHVSTLPRDEMIRAREAIQRAAQLARSHGRTCEIQGGLLDVVEAGVQARQAAVETGGGDIAASGRPVAAASEPTATIVYSQPLTPGHTRLCLDPWSFAFVAADGDIRPCCMRAQAVGNISDGRALHDLADGPRIRELRQQLLTGALTGPCERCPTRKLVPLHRQQAAVREYLAIHGGVPWPRAWWYRARAACRTMSSWTRRWRARLTRV